MGHQARVKRERREARGVIVRGLESGELVARRTPDGFVVEPCALTSVPTSVKGVAGNVEVNA